MSLFGKKMKLQVGQSFGVSAPAVTENQFCDLLKSVEQDIDQLYDYINEKIDKDFVTKTNIIHSGSIVSYNVNYIKARINELINKQYSANDIAECRFIYQKLLEKAIEDYIDIHHIKGNPNEDEIVSSIVDKLKRQIVKLNHPPRLKLDLGTEMFPELVGYNMGQQVHQVKDLANQKRIKLTNSSEFEIDHQLYDWSQRTKRG